MIDPVRVAHLQSASLPAEIQAAIVGEDERVVRDVLQPRRLARRRVLLVGGAGYIGSPLTSYLLERGYDVRCLDLLLYDNRDCVTPFLGRPGYEFVAGDVADAAVTEAA